MELVRKETKGLTVELKVLDAAGSFVGMGAVYGVVDEQNDIIEPGAFTRTLQHTKGQVPLLYQHNSDAIIGLASVQDTPAGLYVAGQLNLDVAKAKEVYALMKQGAIKGLSIGYDTVKATWEGAVRHLKELRLGEMSVTGLGFQAQPGALIDAVKQLGLKVEGKPFGEYSSFADCVAKNQDQDSPEGFCAYLHYQVTGSWPNQGASVLPSEPAEHRTSDVELSQKMTDEALAARIRALLFEIRAHAQAKTA